ncbi:MAG: hypothetical protein KME18_26670 [Phormidium tanganyikae FI6-MK23]|jgi:predicted transposase YdaD|nr:hypothetical protein [Phormidium tanganyikae FI6-MK23]
MNEGVDNTSQPEAVLGITNLQETRFYQRFYQAAKENGREEEGHSLILQFIENQKPIEGDSLSSFGKRSARHNCRTASS